MSVVFIHPSLAVLMEMSYQESTQKVWLNLKERRAAPSCCRHSFVVKQTAESTRMSMMFLLSCIISVNFIE